MRIARKYEENENSIASSILNSTYGAVFGGPYFTQAFLDKTEMGLKKMA